MSSVRGGQGSDQGSTAGGLKGLQIGGQFIDLGRGEPLAKSGHPVWTAFADARAQRVGVATVNEVWSLQGRAFGGPPALASFAVAGGTPRGKLLRGRFFASRFRPRGFLAAQKQGQEEAPAYGTPQAKAVVGEDIFWIHDHRGS